MRKLGTVGIALLGLVFLLNAITYLFGLFSVFTNDFGVSRLLVGVLYATPVLLSAAAGATLLLRRERLAGRWFPDDDSPLTIAAEDLARIGIVLVGVYMFTQAFPTLVSQIANPLVGIAMANAQVDAGLGAADVAQQMLRSVPNYLATVASFIVGWMMVANSERLAKRLVGMPPATVEARAHAASQCPSCGARFDPSDYEGGLTLPRCPECQEVLPTSRA